MLGVQYCGGSGYADECYVHVQLRDGLFVVHSLVLRDSQGTTTQRKEGQVDRYRTLPIGSRKRERNGANERERWTQVGIREDRT